MPYIYIVCNFSMNAKIKIMKKLLLLLTVIVIASCKHDKLPVQETQDNVSLDSDSAIIDTTTITENDTVTDSANPIAATRAKVERINTVALQKKHFEFMCDEKMMVDYFYRNGEIVKIAIDFGTVGDIYAKEGYYYDAGKLVFVYEYTEGGPACEGCINIHEYRTYIADDKVLRHLKDDKPQECRKCNFSAGSRHYTLLQAKTQEQVKAILCR